MTNTVWKKKQWWFKFLLFWLKESSFCQKSTNDQSWSQTLTYTKYEKYCFYTAIKSGTLTQLICRIVLLKIREMIWSKNKCQKNEVWRRLSRLMKTTFACSGKPTQNIWIKIEKSSKMGIVRKSLISSFFKIQTKAIFNVKLSFFIIILFLSYLHCT